MTNEQFLLALQAEANTFNKAISTDDGEWIIKGFIDVYQRIYTISVDTKVVSKVLEILLLPAFDAFAKRNGLKLELPPHQNFYPDLSFTHIETGRRFAVDIKSTYRATETQINGMTLGAFTGYFRQRASQKNTLYPYGSYEGHYALGVIYSKGENFEGELRQFSLDELSEIRSVIRNFEFFAQPKYKIASYRPGSGNTKNIGSATKITDIRDGKGPFASLGEEVYDDYWMYYLTADMAREKELPRPYSNLQTYLEYKERGVDVLKSHAAEIARLAEDETMLAEEVEEAGE
ncbi:restriction endonuclease [bacterium]|nr:MAG: restriction endonuclease [bacterium]